MRKDNSILINQNGHKSLLFQRVSKQTKLVMITMMNHQQRVLSGHIKKLIPKRKKRHGKALQLNKTNDNKKTRYVQRSCVLEKRNAVTRGSVSAIFATAYSPEMVYLRE